MMSSVTGYSKAVDSIKDQVTLLVSRLSVLSILTGLVACFLDGMGKNLFYVVPFATGFALFLSLRFEDVIFCLEGDASKNNIRDVVAVSCTFSLVAIMIHLFLMFALGELARIPPNNSFSLVILISIVGYASGLVIGDCKRSAVDRIMKKEGIMY